MKNVVYLAPIDYVTGKLPFNAASDGKTLGICGRHNAMNNKGIVYNSLSKIIKRSTAPSQAETAARTRFKAIQALVATRRNTASVRATDQTGFEAQSTYKTLKKYIWAQATAAYLASQQDE